MESIVKSLNENYHLKKTTIKKDVIILQIESELKESSALLVDKNLI